MAGALYFKNHSSSQSIYYTLRSLAPKNFKIRPDLDDTFIGEFLYPLNILENTIPFNMLKHAQTVLHVGFDRTYFDKGMSHPLIESAVVGDTGMVRCIDPDPRNVDGLNQFSKENNLRNIKAIHGAVWNREEQLEFVFDKKWGPLSGAVKVPGQMEYSSKQSGNIHLNIMSKTLDGFVSEIFGDRPLDFLGLTANGAETEILEGASKTIEKNPSILIGMAMAFGHFSFEIRQNLCDDMIAKGWNVIVSNSLHDPWSHKPFLWSCLTRDSVEVINQTGIEPVTWEQARELAIQESKIIKLRADQIREHLENEYKHSNSLRYRLSRIKQKAVAMKKAFF